MASEQLLERLMNEYGDALLRMSYVYLKDYYLAEDAVQETFFKAMRFYETFQNKSAEKTWLTRIAINCCKNIMRTRWFRTYRIGLTAIDEIGQVKPFDDLLEKNSMAGAISSLAPADREVILLYYYQNLSTKEIASIIKKNENAIVQRLSRARNRLKKVLLEVGYRE